MLYQLSLCAELAEEIWTRWPLFVAEDKSKIFNARCRNEILLETIKQQCVCEQTGEFCSTHLTVSTEGKRGRVRERVDIILEEGLSDRKTQSHTEIIQVERLSDRKTVAHRNHTGREIVR